MKACRHLGSISLGKITQKLAEIPPVASKRCCLCKDLSASSELFACVTCLESFCHVSHINQHARDRNHPISICLKFDDIEPTLDSIEARFYCSICGTAPQLNVPGKKERVTLEKVFKSFVENQSNLPAKDSISNGVLNKSDHDFSFSKQSLPSSSPTPKGIMNLGNTCFMNSALQLLAATFIRTSTDDTLETKVPLWNSLIHHLREIYSKTGCSSGKKKSSSTHQPVNPREFLSLLSGKQKKFASLQQQDAHDFLRLLFNSCAASHNSLHQEWFGGKFVSRVVCGRCRKVSDTTEPFLDISLSLPNNESVNEDSLDSILEAKLNISNGGLSLLDLLRLWNQKIPLEGENGYYCENCSPQDSSILQSATLQFYLLPSEMPQFLILHLQRFRTSYILSSSSSSSSSSKKGKKKSSSGTLSLEIEKDDRSINFPETLQVPQECFLSLETSITASSHYSLYGYIIHEGSSTNYGHYTAVVSSCNRERWYYISDTQVKEISKLRAFDPDFYNPYLIFYERTSL